MRTDARRHRKALVASATRIFTEQGFDVALQLILDDTGLGRGTLYRHFPDREILIGAVLEDAYRQMADFFEECGDVPDLIRCYLRRAAELKLASARVPDNVDMDRLTEIAKEVADKFRALHARVLDIGIRTGQSPPGFTVGDLDICIRMVIAAGNDPEGPREASIEKALDIILKGLL